MQKILIYEYVTGGGLINEDLTSNLMNEAMLITNSLRNISKSSKYFYCDHLLDYRLKDYSKHNSVIIKCKDELYNTDFLRRYDYIIPIMPESELILYDYSKYLESFKINTVLSDSRTIRICSDKYEFYNFISSTNIKTIKTYLKYTKSPNGNEYIIKDRYGTGCSHIRITKSSKELKKIKTNQIIQEYISGEDYSASVFFTNDNFYLLTINQQFIKVNNKNQIFLSGIMVNIKHELYIVIISLISKIKSILPGLQGFVGIDFLISKKEIFIVEINPRLTTSFVGVYETLGVNIIDLIINAKLNKNVISGKQLFLNTNAKE